MITELGPARLTRLTAFSSSFGVGDSIGYRINKSMRRRVYHQVDRQVEVLILPIPSGLTQKDSRVPKEKKIHIQVIHLKNCGSTKSYHVQLESKLTLGLGLLIYNGIPRCTICKPIQRCLSSCQHVR